MVQKCYFSVKIAALGWLLATAFLLIGLTRRPSPISPFSL